MHNVTHEELIKYIKSTRATADDQTAAKAVFFYPEWVAGKAVKKGDRIAFEGKLYKVIQDHTTQDNWKPSQATASLWEVIDVEHAGTAEDPIPWSRNMISYNGKYYTWESVLYKCIRDSGIALQYSPDQLLNNYFELAQRGTTAITTTGFDLYVTRTNSTTVG